jgi:hypothetical protein
MPAKTFSGARAIIKVNNVIVAIAENYSYTVSTPMEPIFVLGKFDSTELVPLSYEAIPLSLSGVRIIGKGPHTTEGGSVLTLDQLLTAEEVDVIVNDRQGAVADGGSMITITGCKSTGYSTGVGAKGTQRININYLGRIAYDESGAQADSSEITFG